MEEALRQRLLENAQFYRRLASTMERAGVKEAADYWNDFAAEIERKAAA